MPRAVVVLTARAASADVPPPLVAGGAVLCAVSGPRGRALAATLALTPLEDGAAAPAHLAGLIDVRALDAPGDVIGALAHAKGSLWLAQGSRAALLDAARAGGAFFLAVTDLSHSSPVSAAVHGMLKTAALEWPEVACAVLDVVCTGAYALDASLAVAAELRCGFRDLEVVRDARGRFVPLVVERPLADLSESAPAFSERAVLVASGGARGVTATTLLALARARQPALLLLGRTPLVAEPACCRDVQDEGALKRALLQDACRPPALKEIGAAAQQVLAVREIRAFLAELAATGARVLYRAVDVRSIAEVAGACDDARAAFGPITGIVHGAGVLADKRIEDKTTAQVDRVMDTKVLGLHALLEATRGDPLEVIALFSSVAGRFGNVGQVDYAMANEALNEMAVHLACAPSSGRAPVVKSFNWGPWEGGMVTPALKQMFLQRGVAVLTHEDGARHFVDELMRGDDAVEIVFGGELARPAPTHANANAPTHATGPTSVSPPSVAEGIETSVRLHASTAPAYADHAVAGLVVLPAAGALALMAEATGACSFTDVRVFRGIKLPRFYDEGHLVHVRTSTSAAGTHVSLSEPSARMPSYRARIASHAVPRAPALAATLAPRVTVATPSYGDTLGAHATAGPYAALLFHGPRFHLIDAIDAMADDGCHARVHGCVDAGWGLDLPLDVGALDAALQLALLWARHRTGGAYLPTAIARVDASPPRSGSLHAVLQGRSCDASRALVDVQLWTASGDVAFSLVGIEVHRLANDDAFHPLPSALPGAHP